MRRLNKHKHSRLYIIILIIIIIALTTFEGCKSKTDEDARHRQDSLFANYLNILSHNDSVLAAENQALKQSINAIEIQLGVLKFQTKLKTVNFETLAANIKTNYQSPIALSDLVTLLKLIKHTSDSLNVSFETCLAIATRESCWQPDACGAVGYYGLYQVSIEACADVKIPFHKARNSIFFNAKAGVLYFAHLSQTMSESRALLAYRKGATFAASHRLPLLHEYVSKVYTAKIEIAKLVSL